MNKTDAVLSHLKKRPITSHESLSVIKCLSPDETSLSKLMDDEGTLAPSANTSTLIGVERHLPCNVRLLSRLTTWGDPKFSHWVRALAVKDSPASSPLSGSRMLSIRP